MSSTFPHRLSNLARILIVSLILTSTAFSAPDTAQLDQILAQLDSPDAAARDQAARKLLEIAPDNRAALMRATRSRSPEVSARAAWALSQLPVAAATDPLPVRQMLSRYGEKKLEERLKIIANLAVLPAGQGRRALARLVFYDPSAQVRWAAAAKFARSEEDPVLSELRLQAIDMDDPPQIVLAAWAARPIDVSKSLLLLQRAVDLVCADPSQDALELQPVVDYLIQVHFSSRNIDEIAILLRRLHSIAPRANWYHAGAANRFDDLFAYHAMYGPLRGFAGDVMLHPSEILRPKVLYSLGEMARRRGFTVLADSIGIFAHSQMNAIREERKDMAQFLMTHRFNVPAEREVKNLIDENGNDTIGVIAKIWLGELAEQRGDNLAAAKWIQAGLEGCAANSIALVRSRGDRTYTGEEATRELWAIVHVQYLRAAKASRNAAMASEHAAALAALAPLESEVLCDAAPVMLGFQMEDLVRRMYQPVYTSKKRDLKASPDDPQLLNAVAWLSACCKQNLDEALELAERAVAGAPQSGGILDTLAEVHYARGNFAEAVRLEKRAIELAPETSDLKKQLEKYQAALVR